MNTFERYKEMSKNHTFSDRALKAMEKGTKRRSFSKKEEGFWSLTEGEDGSASAIIRFLPPKDNCDVFVKVESHFFKGAAGRWVVIDKCPRSIGKRCPICETAFQYNKNGDKDKFNVMKSRASYYFNILVVKDNAKPENNGKVFLFKCGASIYKKVLESMRPQFEDDEPKRPFEVFEGNNFILRMKRDPAKNNLPQYDASRFEDRFTNITDSPEKLDEILSQMQNLEEVLEKDMPPYEFCEDYMKYGDGEIDTLPVLEDYCSNTGSINTGSNYTSSHSYSNKTTERKAERSLFPTEPSELDELPFKKADDDDNVEDYFANVR